MQCLESQSTLKLYSPMHDRTVKLLIMEDLRLTKAIAEVLGLLERAKTENEDYSECRILFKECSVLRSLPYNERTNVSFM